MNEESKNDKECEDFATWGHSMKIWMLSRVAEWKGTLVLTYDG